MESFIYLFGPPARIITDRGSCFTSQAMVTFCGKYGIKHIKNAVATPRANGQCERYNLTILNSLRCHSANDDDENMWDSHIKLIQFSINSTINKTTGKSPYQILMGINPTPLADAHLLSVISDNITRDNLDELRHEVSKQIQDKQQKAKLIFDAKRKPGKPFKVNDLVMVRKTDSTSSGPKKLQPKFKGPFRIVKVLDNDRYVVTDLRSSRQSNTSIIAIDSLKSWIVLNDQESQPV